MTTLPRPVPSRLPDVRQALEWRELHAGLDEAAARRAPILCLAEPEWTNGAQRLALVLGQDDATRELVRRAFVPIRIDPIERPDVAARLRWASATLTGTAGPPLLALLTHRGAPFLAYCSLWPEGRGAYPSLRSLLHSVADLDRERRGAIEAEALRLQALARGSGTCAPRYTAWQAIRDDADTSFGGLLETPKHPNAPLLWRLLREAEHGPVREHLLRTLESMQRGGILDQLGGSFHRCSRDERWVVPHFEKLVPVNAALAAVYARAGAILGRADFVETARGAAAFATAGLAEGAMAVGADAEYYTWTPRRFQEVLDPELVQALGLHFNVTRDESPHVLFRALEVDDMGDFADEAPEVLRERVDRGRRLLALVRSQRPAPRRVRIDAPAWHAETLRWLFEAGRSGLDVDEGALVRHLRAILEGPFDDAVGYARGASHWLEDQTAIAAACLAAPASAGAGDTALRLATVVAEAYCDRETGALGDRPRLAAATRTSQDVIDHALAAAVPLAIDVLRSVAGRDDAGGGSAARARHARSAERIERHHRDALHAATGSTRAPQPG